MEFLDVVLINPPWSKLESSYENLALGYLAAFLRKNNIKVKIVDAALNRWDAGTTLEELKKLECRIFGISILYQDAAREILDFSTNLKKLRPDVHVTIGGIYPTFAYEEILTLYPAIDTVVLGEGEATIFELATALIGSSDYTSIKGIAYRDGDKIVKTSMRPSIDDLDEIPFPERDTLEQVLKIHNFASMLTSRGCYGRCSFCCVVPFYSQFGDRYRLRSAENVLEEIEDLYYNYNVRNIVFNDANFIGGSVRAKERAKVIAEEIIKRNLDLEFRFQCRVNDVDEELFKLLKRAGLSRVYLGIESGSQAVLDRFKKDATVEQNMNALKILAKLDIDVSMGFIMFDDRMNLNELSENIAFLNNAKRILKKDRMVPVYPLSKLLPLTGTEIERYMKENGKYIGNSLEYSYKFDDPAISFFYNFAVGMSRIIWPAKRLIKQKLASDKEFLGGWRKLSK